MVSRRLVISLVAALAALAGGCSPASDEGQARPVVAVTTNILADLVSVLAGDDIEVLDLMPRGADPHSFGLSASEAARIEQADLVISNGLGLEEGLAGRLERLTHMGTTVIEVGPSLDPLPYGPDVTTEGSSLDPHVWTDPLRMVTAVEIVVEHLGRLDPPSADRISARAAAYTDELEALHRWIDSELEAVPAERRKLVTNHHVFGYFADRYGFEVVGAVIPSGTTLASPSAADLADLASQLRTSGVRTIFAESSQPTRLADALAAEVGLDVEVVTLYTESLGPEGGEAGTYLDMMRYNAQAIVASLR